MAIALFLIIATDLLPTNSLVSRAQGLATQPAEPPIESPAPNSPNASSIPVAKVHQFVQAYLQVVRLIEERQVELQSAETDSESLRIQQELEATAFSIIEHAGLTRQEYLQLLNLANTDPEFGEQIALQLQEANPG
jgi:hypothetical protein